MKNRIFKLMIILAALSLVVGACVPRPTPTPPPTPEPSETATPEPAPVVPGDEPYQITGSFSVTNNFVIATYIVEHAVALVDMHGFVIRDQEWEIPVTSQVIGHMAVNEELTGGTFDVNLPLRPEGEFNDVDNDGKDETGVQIFAVSYWPNLYGGPYSEGDDRSQGWPAYLASVKTDSENNDEVTGGTLVIWAPDDAQSFPAGFGTDGLLFTEDDPSAPVPAGYTIVDLDEEPFAFSREASPEMTLYEPTDVALKDYSAMSYTEAFDAMFEVVSKEYAFNGVDGKQPDWEALYAEVKPQVEKAEADQDAQAYYLALRNFVLAFNDGHVGLGGGQIAQNYFTEQVSSGYGFAIRELTDGRAIVTFLTPDGPAAKAGIELGAVVTEWNGKPVAEAIGEIVPFSAPLSTDFSYRYQQARYLLRGKAGDTAEVTFTNPGGAAQIVELTAVQEFDSFSATSIFVGSDPNALPVEFEILDSGVGYVKINSNNDDLNLIIRLFERALKTFQANEVPGIIIDLRQNSGGAPLGLAGFLTDKEITMGQLEYYSEATGKFEPEGQPDKVLPNTKQYPFDKMVLMVGQACASACELEAYGFSQVPGMIVVGETPSSGTEAEVARGQFQLPEGMFLQVPTGRFVLPDGSIFLEGQGVQPTLPTPITEEYALSTGDELLKIAEQAVLQPLGAGIEPSGPPAMLGQVEAEAALSSGAGFLEQKAREEYTEADVSKPGTLTYTVALSESEPLIWNYYWCATSQDVLVENFKNIELYFELDGEEIPLDEMQLFETTTQTNLFCRVYYAALTDWPAGEHHLVVRATFKKVINDGVSDYPAGEYIYDYKVYVKP
ncbi:MAG: S41 family peptidase [Chloroflexota bacterium]